jgi:hypothetical protein
MLSTSVPLCALAIVLIHYYIITININIIIQSSNDERTVSSSVSTVDRLGRKSVRSVRV